MVGNFMESKLKQILKDKFPEEETDSLAKILSMASRKGKISYEEIASLGGSIEDLLFLYKKRLLIPIRTGKSLAWDDRTILSDKKSWELYEMPNVVQNLIKGVEETGRWNPLRAIQKYLKDIGEPKRAEILELCKKILGEVTLSKTNKVSPELLTEYSRELGLDADKTIAKLKGGGVISPCLRNLKLQYEINPSLYV